MESSLPAKEILEAHAALPAHAALKGAATPDALAKGRAAYQDFFALWKDADPGIPILKQAKAEYAALQAARPSSVSDRGP